jgi:ABC-type multidrug transport system ATPase subunit
MERPASAGPAVQAEELAKTYPGDVQAVRGVSFKVAAGEAFGLLGPNGAGKTTTIGMLNTAVVPSSGRALLAGRDVARDTNGARAISSVVFQDAVVDEPTVGLDTRIRYDLFDVIATLRERTGVTIIMTTHYLDEAERLGDCLAIIDSGQMVACDTPARLLAPIGPAVLELRLDEPGKLVGLLRDHGVAADDILVIGETATVSLRDITAAQVTRLLEDHSIHPRSATTRPPTLDDVYLRLTGDRIAGKND